MKSFKESLIESIKEPPRKSLSLIGCGNVGISVAAELLQSKQFFIDNLIDSNRQQAEIAKNIFSDGLIKTDLNSKIESDIILIATSDNNIEPVFNLLIKSDSIQKDTICIHFSGSKPASIIKNQEIVNLSLSIHPIKSFPEIDLESCLDGVYCGLDGDSVAIELFSPILVDIGAIPLLIDGEQKEIYHAASVFACNYLNSILELSYRCFEKSGIDRNTSTEIIKPLIDGTLNNIFNTSTHNALTGPIARGDYSVIEKQFDKITKWDEVVSENYKMLGVVAAMLSDVKDVADKESLEKITEILNNGNK